MADKEAIVKKRRGGMVLAWVLLTVAVLLLPNFILSATEPLPWPGRIANVLLPGGLYLALLSMGRRQGLNMLLTLPLMVFGAFQLVLLWMYGRSVLAVDMLLNVLTTNSSEVGELLGQLWPALIVIVVAYVPPLVAGGVLLARKARLGPGPKRGVRAAGLTAMAAGAAAMGLAMTGVGATAVAYSPVEGIFPVNVGQNIVLAARHTMALNRYGQSSAGFTFNARATHPADVREVYLLVVGETSRADRYGLNGAPRPTTPRLSARMGADSGLVTMPRALSQSNTTHKSVPLLLSQLEARNYGDSINRVKSVITAFKEAGFATAFISNQRHNGSYIDFFGAEADTCLFMRHQLPADEAERLTDLDLLPVVEGLLNNSHARKQLIVLHTYGSHFSYADRYAGAMEPTFTPDTYSEASAHTREQLLNAYDNTIVLADSLLSGLVAALERQHGALAGMVFTSDHGEDIFDDGRSLFLHASPCPSFRQLHVPFIVWVSAEWRRVHPAQSRAMHANASKRVCSSTAFFDTALLLGGIATDAARPGRSPLSPGYAEPEPLFLNDHNHAVGLQEAGFTPVDFRLLKSL